MKKLAVGFLTTLFLAFSFGSLNASSIQNGMLVASNDKCGGNGACGSDKKIMLQKCSAEKRAEFDKKAMEEKQEKSEKKDGKCGAEKKPVQKCSSSK